MLIILQWIGKAFKNQPLQIFLGILIIGAIIYLAGRASKKTPEENPLLAPPVQPPDFVEPGTPPFDPEPISTLLKGVIQSNALTISVYNALKAFNELPDWKFVAVNNHYSRYYDKVGGVFGFGEESKTLRQQLDDEWVNYVPDGNGPSVLRKAIFARMDNLKIK